jgi:hypothetical protein
MQNSADAEATSGRKIRRGDYTWHGRPVPNDFYMLQPSLIDALESSGGTETAWKRTEPEKDDLSHRHTGRGLRYLDGTARSPRAPRTVG